jgi:DEAD/DEAH box helicase domain-containing protein
MSIEKILSHWRAEPSIAANITEWKKIEARSAQYVPFPDDLHPSLVESLENQGIFNLYSHQETTWNITNHGENVVIVTGTASGKSLAYNLPVLNRLLKD